MQQVDSLISMLQVYDRQVIISNNQLANNYTVCLYEYELVEETFFRKEHYTKRLDWRMIFALPEDFGDLIKQLQESLAEASE
jgi:hypothetical protein